MLMPALLPVLVSTNFRPENERSMGTRLLAYVLFAGPQGSELAGWPISGCSIVTTSTTKAGSQEGCN